MIKDKSNLNYKNNICLNKIYLKYYKHLKFDENNKHNLHNTPQFMNN